MKLAAAILFSIAVTSRLLAAPLGRPVLYVTQVPIPDEVLPVDITQTKMNVTSAMQSPLADTKSSARGGALWIRYANGTTRNLTAAAGFGGPVDANGNATGFQGANGIAVMHPSVHWSGTKALFSMVVGAPTSGGDTSVFHWQLYEISNFATGQTPIITHVAGQPTSYNNTYSCYDTQDRIIFVSDAPRGGQTHLHPQLDEYMSVPTNTGLWQLDRVTNQVKHLVHTPSGAFSPFVDSAGRVIFVQWDHLSRDPAATRDRAPNVALGETWTQAFNGTGTFENESPNANFILGTPANYATYNNYPEPRNFDKTALVGTNANGNAFNQFFPWECREDGSSHEVQNHLGRHELSPPAVVRNSFTDDPNLISQTGTRNGSVNFLQVVESPTNPGTYYAVSAPELGTHIGGQILSYNGGIAVNPDATLVTNVTPPVNVPNPALGQTPLANPVDLFRNPTPLSDGSLLAVHTTATQYDSNSGPDAQHPQSRYNFRLRMLVPSSAPGVSTFVPDMTNNPTAPQNVTLSYYAEGQLVTYTHPLWELDPVEVVDRTASKPAPLTSSIASVEQAVFDEEGVHAPTFQHYLKQRDLAVMVNRDSTRRDAADKQQPFNLKVAWSSQQTLGATGKIYDIGWLQIMQADAIRGYTFNGANPSAAPVPGRRLMPVPLHTNLTEMPPVAGAPAGSVKLGNDGSWAAVVPANRAVTWHLLDGAGTKSQVKERYWLSFAPGEVRTCAVCHGVNTKDQANDLGAPTNKPEALRALLQYWKSNNPPGSLQHTAPSSTTQKTFASTTINVSRSNGSTGPVSVNFSTVNGTGLAGLDYSAMAGTLTWADGEVADKTITIPLLGNSSIGPNKTFSIALSSPQYGSLGPLTTTTISIQESPFNQWLWGNFGSNANQSGIGGANADPDGDGFENLMEYALGDDPLSPTSQQRPSGKLSGAHLEYSFTRAKSDITYVVEVSDDLIHWTPGSTYGPSGNTPTTGATTDVTPGGSPSGFTVVRDNTAATSGGVNHRFMRLAVQLP